MAEYIDQKKALNALAAIGGCGAAPDTWADGYDRAVNEAYRIVQNISAVDAVEVVRCKDCLWFSNHGKAGCPLSKSGLHKNGKPLPLENDFCSYGERKW